MRPMVWKRPLWPDSSPWMGDCSINACSHSVEGDTLAEVADEMRHHVLTAHPSTEQADRLRELLAEGSKP